MSRYRAHLFFCTHRRDDDDPRGCCGAKGAAALVDFAKEDVARRGLKREVRVNATGCLNACALGQVSSSTPKECGTACKRARTSRGCSTNTSVWARCAKTS